MTFESDLHEYITAYETAEFLADEEERMIGGDSDYHVNGESATLIPESLIVLDADEDDDDSADVAEAIRAENEAYLDAMEAFYGIEPRGWEDSY